MILYKRPIRKKQSVLTILFIILLSAILYASISQNHNLLYFAIVAFIFCSLFSYTGFEVSLSQIFVRNYYFYGFIRKKSEFDRNEKLVITTFGLPFGQEDEATFTEGETAVGCLLSIALFFTYKPKITQRRFKIEQRNQFGAIIHSANVLLNEEEYDLIKTNIVANHQGGLRQSSL